MKHIKSINEVFGINIHLICKKYNITNYTINKDGSIDVDGDVNLNSKKLKKIPLKFNIVTGEFDCYGNQLITLDGCPREVGMQLGGNFICDYNKLTSLEGSPEKIEGSFSCIHNELTSLKGCTKEINNNFYCSSNQLTSLEGGPEKVDGTFNCAFNKLISLKGCPKKVKEFNCYDNELTSLKDGPIKVEDNYFCGVNKIIFIDGFPKEVVNYFICNNNPIYEIYRLFPDDRSFMESLDYSYFKGLNNIDKIRFREALREFGITLPEKLINYKYI